MQPSRYGINFAGPFLGLNTVQAPHMLGPGFATLAENTLITRAGGVRPRDPWRLYWQDGLAGVGAKLVGMLHLNVATLAGWTGGAEGLRVLAKADGKLYQFAAFGESQQFKDLTPSFPPAISSLPPTWVFANRRLYVIDGSPRMVQYDGEDVFKIGIEEPLATAAAWEVIGVSGPGAGYYRYAITYYNSVYGIESNGPPVPTNPPGFLFDDSQTMQMTLDEASIPVGCMIDTVRIYRQHYADANGDALGLPFRLVGVRSADDFGNPWVDYVANDDYTLSDPITGPFAPTRNGIPPAARIATWYKDRMWYADPDDGSLLWFSEFGFPEHVGSTSFIRIGGDSDDVIAGMVEMAGQVIILKKDSIWILSGDLDTYDNTRVALALGPGDFTESFPEVYKSKSKTGCHATAGGNGAIVCGHPPLLYYSNANGLYRFDGVDDRLVSDLIMDEWATMLGAARGVSESDHSISYAVDLVNEVLYVCPSAMTTATAQGFLCYHWGVNRGDGVGVWTTATDVNEPLPSPPAVGLVRLGIGCIATCLGAPAGFASSQRVGHVSPLLVAGLYYYTPPDGSPPHHYTELRYAEFGESEEDIPVWKWRTGDLMLAGGKKAHIYYWEYNHERFAGELSSPRVRPFYTLWGGTDPANDGQQVLLGAFAGWETQGRFMRRLRIGRSARSITLEFTRGDATAWRPWNGLTGFAIDVELAEQR